MGLFDPFTHGQWHARNRKRRGRKLPKRTCSICGRLVSIMSSITRNKLRAHKCIPIATEVG